MDPLVSTADLAAKADVQIIDASWFLPDAGRSGAAEYAERHIPGAVFFDIDAIADVSTGLPHMLLSPQAFAEAAGRLGLSREAEVVVYDSQGLFSAPRVWWTLRVMGFPKVRVLDGGLKMWLAEGRPVTADPTPITPTALEARFDSDLVRHIADVRAALAGSAQVVDARGAPRFRGEAPEPRPGVRAGHMPGALNLPYARLITPEGTLKSAAEIRQAFESTGVVLERPIVTTCGSGVTASILALALARLGFTRIPVYDGSWSEWGSQSDTPVATGP